MKFIQETTNVKLFTQYLFCIESSANSSHQRTTRIIHQREQTANNERTKRQRDCGCVFTPLYSPKSTWPLLYKSPIGGAGGRGSLPHESRELIPPKGGVTGTKVAQNFTGYRKPVTSPRGVTGAGTKVVPNLKTNRNPVTPHQGGSATPKPKVWEILRNAKIYKQNLSTGTGMA